MTNALCAYLTRSCAGKTIILHTDHEPMVWAAGRGLAKGRSYNQALVRIHELTQAFVVKVGVAWIPGSMNPAADNACKLLPLGLFQEEEAILAR